MLLLRCYLCEDQHEKFNAQFPRDILAVFNILLRDRKANYGHRHIRHVLFDLFRKAQDFLKCGKPYFRSAQFMIFLCGRRVQTDGDRVQFAGEFFCGRFLVDQICKRLA